LVGRVFAALENYLNRCPVGVAFASPADISWGSDVLVQPDVFVVRLEEARTLDWSRMRHLPLAVEVLSPSTAERDRFLERRRYQEAGVPLYWIVDGDAQQVEIWTPEVQFPAIERDRLVWQPEGAVERFELSLAELFRPI
jgi:Uma2 family endonuclease